MKKLFIVIGILATVASAVMLGLFWFYYESEETEKRRKRTEPARNAKLRKNDDDIQESFSELSLNGQTTETVTT